MGFVGRQREILAARGALQREAPGLVLITGVPGIGKSALIREIDDLVGHRLAVGRGLRVFSWRSYFAFETAVGRAFTGEPHVVARQVHDELNGRVLVIDDAHWCDSATIEAIEEMASLTRVGATVRPGTIVAQRLSGVALPEDCVHLEPLTDSDATMLVSRLRPGLPAIERRHLVATSDGNPLHLQLEMLRGGGPEARIVAEIERLSAPARKLLGTLAIAGIPPELAGVDVLSELVATGLATVDGKVHDTVAALAIEALDPEVLASVRIEVASTTTHPGLRARCLADVGNARGALESARQAALAAGSDSEYADHLLLAASFARGSIELATEAAAAAVNAGRYAEAVDLLEPHVSELADTALLTLARASWSAGRHDVTALACSKAHQNQETTGPETTASLLALEARVKGRVEWDGPGALSLARRAAKIAASHDLRLSDVEGALATASLVAGTDEWRPALERTMRMAGETGDRWALMTATDTLFIAELLRGDPQRCIDAAELGLTIAREIGSSMFVLHMRKNIAIARFHVNGELRAVIDELESLAKRVLHPRTRDHTDAHLALALADAGDDAGATRVVNDSASWNSADPTTRAMIAWAATEVHWAAGRWEDAIDRAVDCQAIPALGFPAAELVEPVRQWACFDLDIDPGQELATVSFVNIDGARIESAAIVALAENRAADAWVLFRQAAAAWSGASVRSMLRCRWGAVLSAERSHQPEQARLVADALADRLHDDGREPLHRRLDAVVRRLGGRGTVSRRSVGPFTAFEADILRLVAQGLDSVHIGRRLQISRATVDSTVKRAMVKVGSASRVGAAARLSELDARSSAEPTSRRLIVAADEATAGAVASSIDAQTVSLDAYERWKFDLADPATVLVANPTEAREVDRVILAAARGAHVVIWGIDDLPNARRVSLLGELQRLDDLEWISVPQLETDVNVALQLLQDGYTVATAALRLGLSTRTLHRRLAEARQIAQVPSNAALIVRVGTL